MTHLWTWFVVTVWPNLLASLIWAGPAFLWHHYRIRKRLDAIHGYVAAAAHHDREVGGG